jgi:multiple sugar transport system substrate-binding protein
MTTIDPSQPIPIYYQLKTLILEDIASGRYQPGDRIPTEVELCAQYEISRTPVRRALAELADEGVIFRHRRRGTFVNPHWVPRPSDDGEIRALVSEPVLAAHIAATVADGFDVNVATVDYTDLHRTLIRAVAEGRAPDLAVIDEVWISEFADNEFLLPLDELDRDWVESEYMRDFVPTFVQDRVFHGQVYAVPEEINVSGLWCSRPYLAAAGMEPPRSWEELVAVASATQQVMAGRGDHAVVMPGGHIAGETTTYCLLAVLASNGVTVIDDGIRLDSAACVEALRLLRSLIDEGLMSGDVVTFEWNRAPKLLGTGRAALAFGGSYEAATIAAAAGISLADVWDEFVFVPVPAGPRGAPATVAGGMAYVIFRQSADPARAMHLLRHLVATERLAARATGLPTIPARLSAVDLVSPTSPFVAETASLLGPATTRPGLRSYFMVSAQLQTMLEAVLTGRHRPAAAVERTADIIAAITGLPVRH